MSARPRRDCPHCWGKGWRVEEREGRTVAVPCGCRQNKELDELLEQARIPPRFRHCTLQSFQLWNPQDPSLAQAKRRTQEFVDAWPAVQRGLLFTGRSGTGKTHLAVAALREVMARKGAAGFYVNFVELVMQLQMSFDGQGASRAEILDPVVGAELLVLDELGAGRPTPWAMDVLYFVVNTRYMHRRITLCTSNYSDASNREVGEESLADRLSAPVRSRLYEMCDEVKLYGEDYRAFCARGRRW